MSHGKAKKFSSIGARFLAVVLVTLGNAGCGSKYYAQQAVQGYEYCVAASENAQAIVQSMEIFVRRSPSNPTYLELDIRPESVLEAGVPVSIYLANESNQFRVVETQIPLDAGQEYFLGNFPDTLYEGYTSLVINPYQAGAGFLDADGTYTAVCYLPALGDGLDQYGNPVGSGN